MKKYVLALAIIALASCTNNGGTANESQEECTEQCCDSCKGACIDGKTFKITELGGVAFEADSIERIISFEDGRASATVGGNNIFAEYEAKEDGIINLSAGGATKMMCPPELREDEFIDAFNKIAKYSCEKGKVSFFDAEGNLLFKAEK